ncbi:ATP-binding protein [Acidipropionibacterium jensenii]|uniref:ATP-binding protein n=1 Tax=Acidipropionibacterium jensenii TaxID=1749 RepID=UPI000FDAA4C9|nr:ATP-binding protein [Acidipropionibacterium jensenii]
MPIATYDTVLINGSVGTGKTTTAEALGDEVKQRGIPGAVIDVDWLRRSWPSPRFFMGGCWVGVRRLCRRTEH